MFAFRAFDFFGDSAKRAGMTTPTHTGPHQFNMPAWISQAPFEQLLGMETVKAEAGEAILRMPFLKALAQGAGLMHGGALVSLADTAVVMAIKSILAPGTHFATTALESRFLHPVKKGIVTARAAVVERQDRVLKGTCDILDDTERSVMQFTSVFKIARDAPIRDVHFDNGRAPVSKAG
ncbi:phenylacetic acid degradation-related protein [Desulfosarcina variabilis str. Montpellier]